MTRGMADAVADIGSYRFIIEYTGRADSAYILASIKLLKRFLDQASVEAVPLLVVPFMGSVGEKLCDEAKISWLDLSGNMSIRATNLLLKTAGQPNRFKRRGRPASVFAHKSSRITRWLLIHPGKEFKQIELARALDLGRGLVSIVVRSLVDQGYCEVNDTGHIHLINPGLLLDDWREYYNFAHHHMRKGTCPAVSGAKLMQQVAAVLKQSNTDFAFTGFAAAWNMTKHAVFRNVTVYVSQLPDEVQLQELDFQEGDAGANIWFVIPDDAGVFHGVADVEDVPCVHPVQVYLDLGGMPGRSEEAAAEIYRRYIKLNER